MKRIVLLAQRSAYGSLVYHYLAARFPVAAAIVEPPMGVWEVAQRRVRRLGVAKTLGQIAFRAGVAPFLANPRRAAAIMRENGLDAAPIPNEFAVTSVNAPEAVSALRDSRPDIVILGGTRILTQETLAAVPATFVNIHAGMAPLYRGVHGAYWALAQGDPAHCGVTVHLVDAGIDTGGILAQVTVAPASEDNFTTYPLLQVAAGLRLLCDDVLPRLMRGDASTRPAPAGASRLWSHPTAWEYLRVRWQRGVK
jgi:methionyl-tRNA formyltransferase